MIARGTEIYKRTAKEHSLDLEVVISIGKAVFTDLVDKLNHPTELAYELDHFGTFVFRQKPFLSTYDRFMKNVGERPEDYTHLTPGYVDRMKAMYAKILSFREKRDEAKLLKDEYKKKGIKPS